MKMEAMGTQFSLVFKTYRVVEQIGCLGASCPSKCPLSCFLRKEETGAQR